MSNDILQIINLLLAGIVIISIVIIAKNSEKVAKSLENIEKSLHEIAKKK